MPDEPKGATDPGPGAKGDNHPGGGPGATKTPTTPDLKAIIAEVASETARTVRTELEATFEKERENHRNQVSRLKGLGGSDKGDGGNKGNGNTVPPEFQAELDSVREQQRKDREELRLEREARQKETLDSKLRDAIAEHPNLLPKAAELIRQAVRGGLKLNSQGEAVFVDGTKHVPLAEKLTEFTVNPEFQQPANKGGGGRPGDGRQVGASGKRLVTWDDINSGKVSVDDLAEGKVEVAALD